MINSKWSEIDRSGSTRYEQYKAENKKNLQERKSETIDIFDKRINNDMFSPRMTKMDLARKNSELL